MPPKLEAIIPLKLGQMVTDARDSKLYSQVTSIDITLRVLPPKWIHNLHWVDELHHKWIKAPLLFQTVTQTT